MLVFEMRGETGVLGEKPLRAKERTNNKLNPHMASIPEFELGPHRWEARADIECTQYKECGISLVMRIVFFQFLK